MSGEFVEVLYDFNYHTENGEIQMKAGEELLLIQKSNENWWQVIRSSDDYAFYAPSSYLNIIGETSDKSLQSIDFNFNFTKNQTSEKNCLNLMTDICQLSESFENFKDNKKSENALATSGRDALSFKNPLCNAGFLNFDCDQCKEDQTDISTNEKSICSENSENLFDQESQSPIYMNIPVISCKRPPIPKADDKPLRYLSNDWLEYIEENGRKYYFHSITGKVTWKPPRRHEHIKSTPSSSKSSSPNSLGSLSGVPDPPPKQLKPKLKKLVPGCNESLEPTFYPHLFTILPPGWIQISDSPSGSIYYYNESSKKKWFSSSDENGRTYFYDEDNSESVWELPDISNTSSDNEIPKSETNSSFFRPLEESPQESSFTKPESLSPKIQRVSKLGVSRQFKTRSLIIPDCVNLSTTEDHRGFLPASFGEGYWPSVQDGHFSITRKGTLNKTKLMEGGKRMRKHWTSSFIILTDVFLLFYKDMRSAHLTIPGIKPELCIDLNGALLEWCPEKSSRKNVFQISTVLGDQLLLQDDNAQTTKEWFDTIQASIKLLPSSMEQVSAKYETDPKILKLSRSKSTKHYVSTRYQDVENDVTSSAEKKRKIKDKLKQFFVRRPTLESLREKGILLDEPVFGCHLNSLCMRESRKVPKFVTKCVEVIEEKELTADGLYRASGNLSQVQKIRVHVNQEDYSCLNDEEDVHVLTGALKMFFREMKEPLFPFSMFDDFLHVIAFPDSSSKLEGFKKLIPKMPEPNFETLKVLLQHLLKVTKYHKQNRMQIQNLAIVFGPTLMWPEYVSANIALDMMHQNRIIEFLLLEFDSIFDSELRVS